MEQSHCTAISTGAASAEAPRSALPAASITEAAEVISTAVAASGEAAAPNEAAASGSIPSSASGRCSPEPEIFQDEDFSQMEIDGAEDDSAPPSEVSKEVNHLNELLANFRLVDEEEVDFVAEALMTPPRRVRKTSSSFTESL
ncbi:hypothetical protein EC968_008495 [Mortierella alpina]|nr:hypothetical protein EC968_008495 [Mortierella alpina]